MTPNFSWLERGVLAGSAVPGYFGFSSLEDDLRDIREEGIRTIVSLTEDPIDEEMVEAEGMKYVHIPIDDHTAPSLEQMREFVELVARERERGSPVLVHCFAGIGRTGTMLAAWLVARGTPPADAVLAVRNARPGSLETNSQERAVHHFRAFLAEQGMLPGSVASDSEESE